MLCVCGVFFITLFSYFIVNGSALLSCVVSRRLQFGPMMLLVWDSYNASGSLQIFSVGS